MNTENQSTEVEQSDESVQKSTQKKTGAKDYSLLSMIVAVIWIVTLTLLKGFGKITLDVQSEIIPTGITIAGMFSPVYVSIILDKVKDIKVGNTQGN